MTRYIKGKNGQFTGSIGTGITPPATSPTLPTTSAAIAPASTDTSGPGVMRFEDVSTFDSSTASNSDSPAESTEENPWIDHPTDTVRYLYENLQPRITACQEATSNPRQQHVLAAEDQKYRILMSTAAELSLHARKEGNTNLSHLWSHLMEYARFTQTDTWKSPTAASDLRNVASDVVEYLKREETAQMFLDRGYGRDLAETLEEWHRRSGGRKRGWGIDGQ